MTSPITLHVDRQGVCGNDIPSSLHGGSSDCCIISCELVGCSGGMLHYQTIFEFLVLHSRPACQSKDYTDCRSQPPNHCHHNGSPSSIEIAEGENGFLKNPLAPLLETG